MESQITKKTVLIIEDEDIIKNSLVEALSEEGYRVLTAENGESGLETILKEKPDLTLLDIGLPQMDGLTLLNKLRADEWGATAKIIILTVHTEVEKVAEAMEHDTFDYIIKSKESLNTIVQKVRTKLSS